MSKSGPEAEASPYEADLAQQAYAKQGFEKNTIRPLTGVLMRRTDQERQPWRQERAIGRGVTQAASALYPQTQMANREMLAQSGASPSSGAMVSRQGALGTGGAVARASAGIDANLQQENRYVQGLQNIMRIGTRQASQAQDAMAIAARQHSSQLGTAAAQESQEEAQKQQTIGAGVGIAVTVVAAIA